MNDEAGFLRAIQDRPKDEKVRLAYADWLEKRGDIRAEYLHLEHQLTPIRMRLAQLRQQIDPNWLESVSQRVADDAFAARWALADDAFTGRWVIADGNKTGWVRLDIGTDGQAWSIRTWADDQVQWEANWRDDVVRYASDKEHMPGPFVPPPAARLYLLADAVDDAAMKYGFASWDHGFMDEHLTLRLEGDVLIAEDFTLFKDNSGRSNYRMQCKFKKAKEPIEPATAADGRA